MDLEYIEGQVDVWIETQIKEKKLRSKVNYEKILRKTNNTSVNVRLDGNSNKQSK